MKRIHRLILAGACASPSASAWRLWRQQQRQLDQLGRPAAAIGSRSQQAAGSAATTGGTAAGGSTSSSGG